MKPQKNKSQDEDDGIHRSIKTDAALAFTVLLIAFAPLLLLLLYITALLTSCEAL
tara:strand:+ start:469 stop:633 length:165 start_codon:yes stop_codon:yes gene_type:complete